ncbi:MAG: hypothetical protein ACKOYK_01365 [Cyanobium sp.]
MKLVACGATWSPSYGVICRENPCCSPAVCVSPHRALVRFAAQFPEAEAVQLVRDARQVEVRGAVTITPASEWLARLAA